LSRAVTVPRRAVAKGAAGDALEAIEMAAQAMEFRCKPLDAKAERAVLQKAKDEMQQELSACGASDGNSALDIGTCLAAATFKRRVQFYCIYFIRNVGGIGRQL
jgi:hypothetical protein